MDASAPLSGRGRLGPPPWKDFACELKVVMPKKRINERKNGKRVGTETYYHVPDPAAAVVELAAAKRDRA